MEGQVTGAYEDQEKVAAFMEILGEPADRALQFLQATSWQLEEAFQLYFAGGVIEAGPVSVPPPVPPSGLSSSGLSGLPAPPEQPSIQNTASESLKSNLEEYVRPPLPVKREALYDSVLQYRGHEVGRASNQPASVDAFRNFEDEAAQQSRWGAETSGNNLAAPAVVKDSLAAMYRPPFVLMFTGTFEQAKAEAARQEKWLLVNLQSTKEFSSYMLNRDTWAHEAVKDTVGMSFVFWQVYDDADEGKKVCTFYKLAAMPTTLVLDPITGQKMRSWEGMIGPDRLLEDLVPFLDMGPCDKQVPSITPQKRARESAYQVSDTSADRDGGVQNIYENLRQPSAEGHEVRRDEEVKGRPVQATESSSKSTGLEDFGQLSALPEEPAADHPKACKVAFRFPDGKRSQRRFLLTDPVKDLWSFCRSQVQGAEGRAFRLTHSIPGASGAMQHSSTLTMLEAGVANTMLVMTWL